MPAVAESGIPGTAEFDLSFGYLVAMAKGTPPDTHARGTSRFDRLMSAAELLQGRAEAARSLAALREAALRDATGKALEARWKSLGLPTAGAAAIVSARG